MCSADGRAPAGGLCFGRSQRSSRLFPAPTASGDLNALLTAAQTALDGGNLAAAEQSYRAAVGKNPGSAAAQFGLGNALVRLGKLAEAEIAYKAALAADPRLIAAHANLGVTYYQMNQLPKAADAFIAALKLNPNDAATTYLLGAVRLQEKNLAEAEKLLLKARDLDPKLPEPYYGLGALYQLKGQKDRSHCRVRKVPRDRPRPGCAGRGICQERVEGVEGAVTGQRLRLSGAWHVGSVCAGPAFVCSTLACSDLAKGCAIGAGFVKNG